MSTEKGAQIEKITGVFKRGDTYHFRYRRDGRQLRKSLHTGNEEEAHIKAAQLLSSPDAEARLWEIEVKAYLSERTKRERMSRATETLRLAVLIQFGRHARITTPRKVTSAAILGWYTWLKARKDKPVSEETAQTYVRFLRTFLNHLAAGGYVLPRLSWPEMPRLKQRMRLPFCTAEQVAQLIEAAPDDELRFVLYSGFHAGLRRGEIAEARPEWFDLKAGLLHIQRSDSWEPKDRDARTIPLTKEFVEFLARYGLRSPFMLKGTEMARPRRWRYRYDFRKKFTTLAAGQGMPWVTPHTMRRTFASLKVSAGVSLYKVAVWLGDLESVVQDHYGYLIPKDSDIERGF